MRALVLEGEGMQPQVRDVPQPKAGSGEVLVKISYSGVNYADTMVRRGFYLQRPQFPHVPGIEFSGLVVETGEGVKNLRPGDRVMGMGQGTYAEYTVAPATSLLSPPPSYTDEQAAAFPVVYLTAFGMLRVSAHAEPGETILIHAAAGGVGTAAIQLSKHLGLRVIATASTDEKLALASRLGADVTLNYSKEDFVQPVLDATGGRGADIILESIGGDFPARDIRAAAPFGRIVIFGMASGRQDRPELTDLFRNSVAVSAFWLVTLMREPTRVAPVIRELTRLVEEAHILPVIGRVYPLEQGAQALEDLEGRRTTGKLLLRP